MKANFSNRKTPFISYFFIDQQMEEYFTNLTMLSSSDWYS